MKRQIFPWHKNYPVGVPHEIDPDKYKSLVGLFDECTRKYGPLPAFECMGTSISYSKLDKLSENFAAYLQQELKLRKGTRIAIQLPNVLQYPIAMFGALRAGMIVVNTNPLLTHDEMKQQFADSGTEAIVILADHAHRLEKILPDTTISHIIITETGDQLGRFKRFMVNNVAKYIRKLVPVYNLPKAIAFNNALKQGGQLALENVEIKAEDIAFIQYPGEVTQGSKGAVLTHYNLLANVEQLSAWLAVRLLEREETVITPLPLHHVYTQSVNCFTMMKIGARNILIPNPRDMKYLIKVVKKQRISVITGSNTFYNNLLNHPRIHPVDFIAVKLAVTDGLALSKEVVERWKNVTGIPITEGYGLVENYTVLTFNLPQMGKDRLGSVGIPIPSTHIIIADDNGKEVPSGMIGEIYAMGPQIMTKYWNRPEETSQVFTEDGWYKTGDAGYMERNGFVRILGRL